MVERIREAPRWTLAIAAIGLALLALSFGPGWLSHNRELQGEGYRSLVTAPSAWHLRGGTLPVLTAGVVGSVLVGLLAVAVPRARRWMPALSAIALGLLTAGLVPVAQEGHISRVALTPGWALLIALVGVTAMTALAWRAAPPSGRAAATAAVAFGLVAAVGTGVRVAQLDLVEGPTQHWSAGTWVRAEGEQQLVLGGGTFELDPWSGTIEAAGINAILTQDPACPDARGMYRVRSGGGDEVRWEKIVDTCDDGARAEALEGTWQPESAGGN